MHILVTGGAGYIGSHAVHAFIDAGYDVTVLDDLSAGTRKVVPDVVRFVEGDVGDRRLVRSLLRGGRIDAVVHFAGSIIVPESITDPVKYFWNNTANSLILIEETVAAGIQAFVFSSTAAVYGEPAEQPVTEDAPLKPINPYGRSKLMVEQMLADVSAASALRYVALRYFNVAGADPSGRTGQVTPNATHLIKVACECAVGQRDQLVIFGQDYQTRDGTCVRDFIHVSDLADAHVKAVQALLEGCDSMVLNCGYGRGYSVQEVVDRLQRIAGAIPVAIGDRREGDPPELVADASAIRSTLDWHPQHEDLGNILESALRWERWLRSAPQ
jgi:UDP-glucose 4-epimerase